MTGYNKYKKTSIDWIEEIPEHWNLMKIGFLFEELSDVSVTGQEDLLSVSQYSGIRPKRESIDNEKDNLTNASSLVGYKSVCKGDLVMNIMLAWNGSLGISDFNGIVSPAYCVFRILDPKKYNHKYFHYLFKTEKYKAEFKRSSTGIIESRLRLYPDKFFVLPAYIPSRREQDKIVSFLELKIDQLDKLINKYETLFGKVGRKSGLIADYKNALIEEVALGKVDISNIDLGSEHQLVEKLATNETN